MVRSSAYRKIAMDQVQQKGDSNSSDVLIDYYGPLYYQNPEEFEFVMGDELLFQIIFNLIKKHLYSENFWFPCSKSAKKT